jgi:hypothetical protein
MAGTGYIKLTLDPQDTEQALTQLVQVYDLTSDDLTHLRRVIGLYRGPVQMVLDDTRTVTQRAAPLADKFTFDIETDELILFSRDKETLVDALIEMAMYLAGFSTLMGSEETWIIEFTIGAWKPVKKRIKRGLGLPVHDQPRGIVGVSPSDENRPASANDYPFHKLVSQYNQASFYQMVMLAARDDIAVYFPPESHPKVLAVYVYMRRAMHEVAAGIDLGDHQTFNARLMQEIQRAEKLFNPACLPLPDWLNGLAAPRSSSGSDETPPKPCAEDNPFEAFIEQLFMDDDTDDSEES